MSVGASWCLSRPMKTAATPPPHWCKRTSSFFHLSALGTDLLYDCPRPPHSALPLEGPFVYTGVARLRGCQTIAAAGGPPPLTDPARSVVIYTVCFPRFRDMDGFLLRAGARCRCRRRCSSPPPPPPSAVLCLEGTPAVLFEGVLALGSRWRFRLGGGVCSARPVGAPLVYVGWSAPALFGVGGVGGRCGSLGRPLSSSVLVLGALVGRHVL